MRKFAVVLFLAAMVSCGKQTPGVGEIGLTVGDVTLNGNAVSVGDKVANGDLLVTGQDSSCEVVFGDKNIFHVAPGTEVAMDFSGNKTIDIRRGGIGFVLGNLNEETFEVETSVATAAVRGTVFFVESEAADRAYFCTCNGDIAYDTGTGWVTNIAAEHHAALRLRKAADGSIAELPAGLEYHDDAGVEALASHIGLKIDWTKEDGLSEE